MSPQQKQTFPMMTATVKLCRFVGLWYDLEHQQLVCKAVFTIGCMIVWYMLPTIAFIVRKEKLFNVQLKPILELFFTNLQKAFNEFSDSLHDDIRRTLKHLQSSDHYLVKIYLTVVLFQATSYGLVSALVTIYKYAIGGQSVIFPSTVLEADFVFFDHLSNFWLWLPTMFMGLFVQFLMVMSVMANECLLWNLLHHVSCLFRIVQMEVSRLNRFHDPLQFREQLRFIVHIHEVCFRNARRLESVLSPVLGLLYCSCVFQTCYIMFVLTVVDDFMLIASMVFVLQYTVFLIFSFSMLGTELTEASASISTEIYNIRWYRRSATEQRLLLFMKARSDRVTYISAVKFFPLNRSTFGMAMKTAFSYFTIMRQFYTN